MERREISRFLSYLLSYQKPTFASYWEYVTYVILKLYIVFFDVLLLFHFWLAWLHLPNDLVSMIHSWNIRYTSNLLFWFLQHTTFSCTSALPLIVWQVCYYNFSNILKKHINWFYLIVCLTIYYSFATIKISYHFKWAKPFNWF